MLKIVAVDTNRYNYISINNKEFFITKRRGGNIILPAQCSHRGGPLFFASLSEDGKFIICPWHKNKFKPCALSKMQIPSIFMRGISYIIVSQQSLIRKYYKTNITIL